MTPEGEIRFLEMRSEIARAVLLARDEVELKRVFVTYHSRERKQHDKLTADSPFADFDVSNRSFNAMMESIGSKHFNNQITLRQVHKLIPPESVLKVRGIGKKSQREIIALYAQYFQ